MKTIFGIISAMTMTVSTLYILFLPYSMWTNNISETLLGIYGIGVICIVVLYEKMQD